MSTLSPAARERRLIVRAGLFVAGALFLAALIIFLIGKEGRLFEKHLPYHGAFDNVEGLNLDSPVRLGGLNVGRVAAITFSPDLGDKRIQVQIEISAKFAERLRADSVARIGSRGVLGDKVIDISLGSADSPRIPVGGEIATGSSGDITSLLKTSGEIMDNALAITRDLREGIAAYTHPQVRSDVAGLIKSAREVFQGIASGNGAAHALLYDRRTAQELSEFLAAAGGAAKRFDQSMARVEQLLAEAQHGHGAAHALFYDPKGAQAIAGLGSAAGELAILLHDSRESPNSAVHQLVYGDAKGMFANLGSAAADIKKITSKIASGEGSLGGIINDPTVYEDLRTILGSVKRNTILRALVRYSISNEEKREGVGKPEEEPKK
jgi:phospholipid/cholesterol/gamma-HCH transport system substrate-binding protein